MTDTPTTDLPATDSDVDDTGVDGIHADPAAAEPAATRETHSPADAGGFLARHKVGVAVTAFAAVVALIVGTVGVPTLVQTIDHANADAAYQHARAHAVALFRADRKVQAAFPGAHTTISTLQGQVKQIHDQAGTYLPAAQITALEGEGKNLAMYAGFKAGDRVPNPHPAGTTTSSTGQLQAETTRLTALADEGTVSVNTTSRAVAGIADQVQHTTQLLNVIIAGQKATPATNGGKAVPAVPALDADAAGVINAFPKATQASKDALTAAAAAALKGAKTGKAPAPLLLDYLTKALAVKTAHDQQVAADALAAQQAAQAAAEANAPTYTDPSTGHTVTNPHYTSGGRGGSSTGGSTSSGGSTDGGAPASGGGSSSGGGSQGVVQQTGYPVFTGPALPINSVGQGSNCGGGALQVPSNAKIVSSGPANDGSGEWCVVYTGPNG